MLELNNVNKSYGSNQILKDINLSIKKGEVISIVGKSGCGKSTLLKCLNGLEKINSGEIKLNGFNINTIPLIELRKKVGIVFQDYNLFDHLNILDNITIGLIKVKKVNKNYAISSARKILKRFKLLDKQYNYPDELSGGERQRVAIIRTLLMKPEIIMLDEPTSALDAENKIQVQKFIKTLVKDDLTLIIVSHEEAFVNSISDRIYQISKGKIKEIKK